MALNPNKYENIDNFIWALLKKNKTPKKKDYNKIYLDIYNFSYEDYTNRLNFIKLSIKQLNKLKEIPIVEQRTEEWYNMRKNMLTASDTYNAINKSNYLIKNKALKIQQNIKCAALTWGIMFEPIATNIYSKENNDIEIFDFGVIKSNDPDINFYGASPDGITSLGTMLEIKCPITRKIKDGDVKKMYMAQVQGQMAVCQLDECDFAEFEFEKIENVNDFLKIDSNITKYFGCVIVNKDDNNKFDYYTPLGLDPLSCYLDTLNYEDNDVIYWKLNKMNIQRILFDKEKWESFYKPKILEFWDAVKNYKDDNFDFHSDSD